MCNELVRPTAVGLSGAGSHAAREPHVPLRVLALRLGVHGVRQGVLPPSCSWAAEEVVLPKAENMSVLPSCEGMV